eukprot:2073125-Rhodomonas_salina.1
MPVVLPVYTCTINRVPGNSPNFLDTRVPRVTRSDGGADATVYSSTTRVPVSKFPMPAVDQTLSLTRVPGYPGTTASAVGQALDVTVT